MFLRMQHHHLPGPARISQNISKPSQVLLLQLKSHASTWYCSIVWLLHHLSPWYPSDNVRPVFPPMTNYQHLFVPSVVGLGLNLLLAAFQSLQIDCWLCDAGESLFQWHQTPDVVTSWSDVLKEFPLQLKHIVWRSLKKTQLSIVHICNLVHHLQTIQG